MGVLDRLFVTDTGEADTLDNDTDTLVAGRDVSLVSFSPSERNSLEVGHDDAEALVLLANQVLDRDLDVLKGDVSSTR